MSRTIRSARSKPIKPIQSNREFNTIQKEKAANPYTPQTLVHNTLLYFLQTDKDQT